MKKYEKMKKKFKYYMQKNETIKTRNVHSSGDLINYHSMLWYNNKTQQLKCID